MEIKELWDTYEMLVVPPHAGDIQRIETRRAFFAGAQAMNRICLKISDMTEDEGIKILRDCQHELTQFALRVSNNEA